MKAVGYVKQGALDDDGALVDFEASEPVAEGHDLLVRVAAISVNPVDYKIRMRRPPEGDRPNVLGGDAVGEVVGVGGDVTDFHAIKVLKFSAA